MQATEIWLWKWMLWAPWRATVRRHEDVLGRIGVRRASIPAIRRRQLRFLENVIRGDEREH